MKPINEVIKYFILFWFMVVSFCTIITLVNLLPSFVENYILTIITFLFNITILVLIYYLTLFFDENKKKKEVKRK